MGFDIKIIIPSVYDFILIFLVPLQLNKRDVTHGVMVSTFNGIFVFNFFFNRKCLGEILFGINTSMRPGMTSRYLMAEFCEPVCSVKAWCAEEQEQNYPARPRCCHSRGQFPIKGKRPFRLEAKRRGDPVDDSWQDVWQDVLSSTRI